MGIDSLTRRDDGSKVAIPVSHDDWQQWVSAGRTRNWMLDDPLLDWLQLYGKYHDYLPKQELADYDKGLDFLAFIFDKGREFEAGILRLFQDQYEVTTVAQDYREISRLDKAEETFEVMRRGVPIIYQAVLWDAQSLNYGSPDFLIRSDVLHNLFPGSFSDKEAETSAPDLGAGGWHYRVVDTKFTTLHLNARGSEVSNDGSGPAYKAQLYIYNRMLGRLQGFEPPESYLLGRGWQRRQGGVPYRGSSAMELLGPVPQNGTVANGVPIANAVEDALRWVRRVRTEGKDWQLLPEPSVRELYPNMSNADDGNMLLEISPSEPEPGFEEEESGGQWMGVKKWLAGELKELTQLWQVGVAKREQAHEAGIYRWDDPQVTPAAVGVSGPKTGPTLEQLLAVNTDDGPPVRPWRIEKTRNEWHTTPLVEFYVDFEFCSDLNDDFSKLPDKGGQRLIFMIGCGHLENGEWQFKSLVAHCLTEEEELRIIREWVTHMSSVRDRLDPANGKPRIFHWSAAELTALESAYNSARVRHQEHADWPELGWYDFLTKVMREEPVVVRGALGFGLKAIANAMHSHSLIETDWADSPIDGLGAMVGAWRCDEEAQKLGVPMTRLSLMDDIARYNEVDCKVMMEDCPLPSGQPLTGSSGCHRR